MLDKVTPSAPKTPQEYLAEYVEKAKSLDIMQDKKAPKWEDPDWDLTAFTSAANGGRSHKPLVFRPIAKRGRKNALPPYAPAFGDVLKAYMAYKLDAFYLTS